MRDDRRWWRVVATLIVLGAAGAVVAWQVNGALGLDVRAADIPVERAVAAPPTPALAPPAIGSIAVPDDERLRLAAGTVADALAAVGAPRPVLGAGPAPVLTVDPVGAGSGLTGESYRVDGLTITAGTPAGAAAGLYAVADRVRSGAALPAGTVTPRLGLRLTDLGAVGLPDDPARYATGTDYSLNSDVVGEAVLPGAPYVDAAAVDRIARQYDQLVRHALAQGYNAVVVPGFLEYVTFAGEGVYPDGDPHVARARAMVAAFGPVWRRASDLGMKVFLQTDMLALSPPLRDHLDRVAGMDTEDDRLWQVYRAGLRELFDSMPFVAGLMVRIGEGGAAYQLPGWDYSSEIAVTTPAAVRAMLRAFLSVAGPAGKDIVFRTWSVGIGAVGDLHTSPAAYDEVLGGLDDEHLVVSTKYTAGDFYSHLPLNPTLLRGTQRRIVEFQSRREFENFGALPNDLGPLHQLALRRFLAENPRVEGVWSWAQGGGPLLAGPRTLFLRAGFWQLYDLNSYLTGRLAWDPDTDPAAATADWLRATFSADPGTVAALGEAMALSRAAVTKGLYIGPYANRSVKALGLEPPPMMWIFEWDIVTGDSAVWDTIYAASRDDLPAAVAQGTEAVADARRMRALVAATNPATWRDPALRDHFLATLDYQVNLFETLGAYRTTMLRHAEWLDTGAAAADHAWHTAAAEYERLRTTHLSRYGTDLDLPAYNLTAADLGLTRAHRDAPMAWLARALLATVLAILAYGLLTGRARTTGRTRHRDGTPAAVDPGEHPVGGRGVADPRRRAPAPRGGGVDGGGGVSASAAGAGERAGEGPGAVAGPRRWLSALRGGGESSGGRVDGDSGGEVSGAGRGMGAPTAEVDERAVGGPGAVVDPRRPTAPLGGGEASGAAVDEGAGRSGFGLGGVSKADSEAGASAAAGGERAGEGPGAVTASRRAAAPLGSGEVSGGAAEQGVSAAEGSEWAGEEAGAVAGSRRAPTPRGGGSAEEGASVAEGSERAGEGPGAVAASRQAPAPLGGGEAGGGSAEEGASVAGPRGRADADSAGVVESPGGGGVGSGVSAAGVGGGAGAVAGVSGGGGLWARALVTAVTRPWRLRGLGVPTRRDRVLVWVVPGVVLVVGRAVSASFVGLAHLGFVVAAWVLFALVLRLSVRDSFPLAAAVGGVVLVRTSLLAGALAVRGPGHYWFDFWTDPVARSVYVVIAFGAFLALFVVTYLVFRGAYGLSQRRAGGRVLLAGGVVVAVLGGFVAVVGAERALTVWNDQMGLLPWGLHRILGITVYLGIPPELPAVACGAGVVLAVVGGALVAWRRPRTG